MDDPTSSDALTEALASSQRLGMVGAGPVARAVEHADAFVGALADVAGTVADLGSGGGVPGLVVAVRRPDLRVVLIERRIGRSDHLQRLVRRLELGDRVEVVTGDARRVGADVAAGRRSAFDAATARGFGPPMGTLRTARRLVRAGGRIVVSEPPDDRDRWPPGEVRALGCARREHADRRVSVFDVDH